MLARNFRPVSNNKMSMIYISYLTLGLIIPFALPAHMTQKILNDCPYLKGKSTRRCIF
ncbi:hypothetical protein ZYGR_0N01640 [Zygosaccharomyces rouxii]|uniref:Uncharacterized protein n=1 Tax=Zygosaccharomyces rouxii TaxID=4956 RepID=A0A1Q2ZZ96_ZYGRO|nr:hypothetical protein LQ764DRAFT_233871 [Zygosaccharomyces rouxii]GAV48759.1 hypothetical protein ZYGR_0N01640 [Zygosaccharomyces rouxii]